MNSTMAWGLVIVFFLFMIVIAIKFRNTKTFNALPLEEGEEILFEENPARIQFDRERNRTTIVMRPVIRITNKRIIVGQRFFRKPDARIYTIFSFTSTGESLLQKALKDGFATVPMNLTGATATMQSGGNEYTIDFHGTLEAVLPNTRFTPKYLMRVSTNNLSGYEKALNIKISVTQ